MEYIKPELQVIFLNESKDIVTTSDGLNNTITGGGDGSSWSEWI